MPHYTEYRCSVCKLKAEREALLCKKVAFYEIGAGGKLKRSRTVGYICPDCLDEDAEWNLPPFKGTPGFTSEALEEVREIKAKEKM